MQSAVLEADVVAAAGGDRQAFARLVDATRGTVSAIALAVVGEVGASEDVAQEVYLAAWRRLGELRNPGSFLPWLRQTTRFRARSWVRWRRRAPSTDGGEDTLARLADPHDDPHQELARREEERLIREALAVLSDADREVLTLFYREGRSVRHVADLLDLGEAAVRQRLSRSRARLRGEVRERLATVLARTAPGTAFTSMVLLSTAAAAPSAAAATGAGLASAAKAGGAGAAVVQLVAAVSGAVLGAAGGVLGVIGGLRRDFRDVGDARELAALRRFRVVAVAGTVAAAAGLAAATSLGGWMAPVAIFAVFVAFLSVLYLGWLPRIVARRHDTVAISDAAAARCLAHRRRRALLGLLLGAVTGGLALLAGLWLDGRFG
jgi:RNA polymerase sigma factor (sigma-70 family)